MRKLEWDESVKRWEAHVEACTVIVREGALKRLELAAEALRQWGNDVEVEGVTRTESCTGVILLRAKLTINGGTADAGYLEFVAAPKSQVIHSEGERRFEKRRWKKISLTAEAIPGHCDEVIRTFMTWGWVKA